MSSPSSSSTSNNSGSGDGIGGLGGGASSGNGNGGGPPPSYYAVALPVGGGVGGFLPPWGKSAADIKEKFVGLPPVTRTVTALLIASWMMQLLLGKTFFRAMVMVPGWILPPYFYLWTLLTAGFYDGSIIGMLAVIVVFPFFGRYLENIWGPKEFVKLLFFNAVTTTFSLLILYIFVYVLTGIPEILYANYVFGTSGLFLGFMVALKQLIPEHSVDIFGFFSIRVKDMPILLLSLQGVSLLWRPLINRFLMSWFGFLSTWIYLRYIQTRDHLRGDRSEAFSFASFFPEAVQPIVKTLATIVFRLLVLLRVCQRVDRGRGDNIDVEMANFARLSASSQSADSIATERRRNLALMALEARLANKSSRTSGTSSPSSATPQTASGMNTAASTTAAAGTSDDTEASHGTSN